MIVVIVVIVVVVVVVVVAVVVVVVVFHMQNGSRPWSVEFLNRVRKAERMTIWGSVTFALKRWALNSWKLEPHTCPSLARNPDPWNPKNPPRVRFVLVAVVLPNAVVTRHLLQ